MMSLMDHSPAARGRVMVRRSICLMSESNSVLAETIAAMTSAFDVGSGIVSLGEPRMARSAHLVADFSGSPAKCGGTGVPSAEVVEIQEKRPHGLERLEGLLQKVGRQHLLVQKGSGDRDLFEPQQLDLWVVTRVAFGGCFHLLPAELSEIPLEGFPAEDRLEGTGVPIDGVEPLADVLSVGFVQSSGEHRAVAGFDVHVVTEPARLASPRSDVSAHVGLVGRFVLGKAKVPVQAEDAVLGRDAAQGFRAAELLEDRSNILF